MQLLPTLPPNVLVDLFGCIVQPQKWASKKNDVPSVDVADAGFEQHAGIAIQAGVPWANAVLRAAAARKRKAEERRLGKTNKVLI
jgi:hypothetical protein